MLLPRLEYDPREKFGEDDCPAVEWVPALGCWCVFGAGTLVEAMKSPDFAAADFAERHRLLQQQIGIDCSALIRICQHLPNANEGDRHATLRKDLARLLANDQASTRRATAEAIHEIVIGACRPDVKIDLVEEIIAPACEALFENILGAARPAASNDGVSPSQIFDLYLGLNRRREINTKASAMLDGFAASGDKLKTSPDYAVALSMVGFDSIVGSLGRSLLDVLESNAGSRLCDISFPSELTVTGVPYVERFAARDTTLAGAKIKKDDRVRLYLEAREGENPKGRPFFGRGRHSCIGEDFSTWIWQALTVELGRLSLVCVVESATRRKPDWVFFYYSSIVARLHA